MRIIEPTELSRWERHRRRTRSYKKLRGMAIFLLILLAAGAFGYVRYNRPLPAPTFKSSELTHRKSTPSITWPGYGQSAIGTVEDGLLADHFADKAAPIASVAKVITALVVLDAKPLKLDQPGPNIMLTETDEAIYHDYIARGGSVSGVTAGKTITEYEALQAVMLPSSNNMSETITNWAFGSQEKYIEAANRYVRKHGLKHTTVADASGFSPQTVSTASDLVRLGILAMNHPVLAQISSQKEASSAVSGAITNVNRLLGVNGTVGIKTGNTDEAGGCFLLATNRTLTNGQTKTVIVAVMGAPTLGQALADSQPLAAQTVAGFRSFVAVTAGQQIGVVTTGWGSQAAALAEKDVTMFGWGNETVQITAQPELGRLTKGAQVGNVSLQLGSLRSQVPMVLSDQLQPPTTSWRVKRII